MMMMISHHNSAGEGGSGQIITISLDANDHDHSAPLHWGSSRLLTTAPLWWLVITMLSSEKVMGSQRHIPRRSGDGQASSPIQCWNCDG